MEIGLKDATYFKNKINRNRDNKLKYSSDFSRIYIKKSMNLFLIVALGHELINAVISCCSSNKR